MNKDKVRDLLAQHRELETRMQDVNRKLYVCSNDLSYILRQAAGVVSSQASLEGLIENWQAGRFSVCNGEALALRKTREALHKEMGQITPKIQAIRDQLKAMIDEHGPAFQKTVEKEAEALMDLAAKAILPYCFDDMDKARELAFATPAVEQIFSLQRGWRYNTLDPAMTASELLGAMVAFEERTGRKSSKGR